MFVVHHCTIVLLRLTHKKWTIVTEIWPSRDHLHAVKRGSQRVGAHTRPFISRSGFAANIGQHAPHLPRWYIAPHVLTCLCPQYLIVHANILGARTWFFKFTIQEVLANQPYIMPKSGNVESLLNRQRNSSQTPTRATVDPHVFAGSCVADLQN